MKFAAMKSAVVDFLFDRHARGREHPLNPSAEIAESFECQFVDDV